MAQPQRGPLELVNVFAGGRFDRAAHLRANAMIQSRLRRSPGARYAAFRGMRPLCAVGDAPGAPAAAVWLDYDAVAGWIDAGAEAVFLGLDGEDARFAIDLSRLDGPAGGAAGGPADAGDVDAAFAGGAGKFVELRAVAPDLADADASPLATARALFEWRAAHRHCGRCGGETKLAEGGWKAVCARCSAEQFPRTDPVVIMLAARGDACVLGHSERFPANFFSTLAGFIEPGESIEEAVRREVLEEVGLRVGRVVYHSSQPWPFPGSLMIGCVAEATSQDITIDPAELTAARWFTRDDARAMLRGEGSVAIPPPLAIAHQLIRSWALGETSF